MRLLSTKMNKMKQFDTDQPEPYAALSHRWARAGDEVLFEELMLTLRPSRDLSRRERSSVKAIRERPGYYKIYECCKKAKGMGLAWVWIDTCCIDKRSSAELSEAINSMWRWYENATWCIVYLADVTNPRLFGRSEWFKRSWTLQELLAPKRHIFYNSQWHDILEVDKDSRASVEFGQLSSRDVAEAAKLPLDVVNHSDALRRFSVAQKLSWAANRNATRLEDKAYSLLGLFQINMPLLYGERRGAIQRLQKEIIRDSADETIFAWHTQSRSRLSSHQLYQDREAVLSWSLRWFESAQDIVPIHARLSIGTAAQAREPYGITHKGLQITGLVYHERDHLLFPLNCYSPDQKDRQCFLMLAAISVTDPIYRDCYARVGIIFRPPSSITNQGLHTSTETLYISNRDAYELQNLARQV